MQKSFQVCKIVNNEMFVNAMLLTFLSGLLITQRELVLLE